VHTIVVLEVTAGHIAVPPLFKANDVVPVEVTASEKLIVTGTMSPIFLVPEPVVVNELIVGADVSTIETVVPKTPMLISLPSTFAPDTTTGVNAAEAPPVPALAVKTTVPSEVPENPPTL